MINNQPILFFDSGIGGVSTLYRCYKLVPNQPYLYYADEDNMPYGNKPKTKLVYSIKNTIKSLINQYNPKIVVLACNTATALVVSYLRNKYKSIIFIGTEPALVPAVKKHKNILLLATSNTIKNSKITNLTKRYFNVFCLCPQDLAYLIENNLYTKKVVQEYLTKLLLPCKNKIDCVVLGCTHYVFFKNYIKRLLKVEVIDGNFGVSKRLKNLIKTFKMQASVSGIKFLNKGKIYNRLVSAYLSFGGKK